MVVTQVKRNSCAETFLNQRNFFEFANEGEWVMRMQEHFPTVFREYKSDETGFLQTAPYFDLDRSGSSGFFSISGFVFDRPVWK